MRKNYGDLIYSLLFCLLITAIDPWGAGHGDIWTRPKLLVLAAIVIWNLKLLFDCRRQLKASRPQLVFAAGWLIFLAVGTASTVSSPAPWRSFYGQSALGDGLLYWIVVAVFSSTNVLLVSARTELFKAQTRGLILGGIILAISIVPQLIDWSIDYTAHSREISNYTESMLVSQIWKFQMPIGLFSHRGYTAFVLTFLAALAGFVEKKFAIAILLFVASCFCKTRGPILGLVLAGLYFLWIERKALTKRMLRLLVILSLLSIGTVTLMSISRYSQHDGVTIDSGRSLLQKQAWISTQARPYLGWGFDGLAIAFPYTALDELRTTNDQKAISLVLEIKDLHFTFLGVDRQVHPEGYPGNKAHNIVLDTLVSNGLAGLLAYALLLIFPIVIRLRAKSRNHFPKGIETSAIVYFVYLMTWFDTAQISHLGWWALSLCLARRPKEE